MLSRPMATAPTLLLDSPSLVYRAYFALPNTIRSPAGRAVNAVRGYLDMATRLLVDRRPGGMVHAFDVDWRPAFRVAAYSGYKANRRPDPPDLPWQFELIREVLDAAGAVIAGAEGYEADDVIGTLADRATAETPVEVVTGDRDLLQLVRDPAVAVLFTVRGVTELHRYDEAAVRARYGVPARHYADMAIIRGDPSDGLPGLRGLGEKTAVRLVAEHGSLDAVEVWAAQAPGQAAGAVRTGRAYLEAMRIVVPVVRDLELSQTAPHPPDRARLARLATEHGIDAPIERLLAALDGLPADPTPPE
jgi:5'-3' exonuclease